MSRAPLPEIQRSTFASVRHVTLVLALPTIVLLGGCVGRMGDATYGAGAATGSDAGTTSDGASASGTGGATGSGTGGASAPGTGGVTAPGTGGTMDTGSGGAAPVGSGGTGAVIGGTGGTGGTGGAGGTAAGGASGSVPASDGLPCDVQTLVTGTCGACHGPTPLPGLPSLATYASLTAPSAADPTQTNAERALARMQQTTAPMPPPPSAPASAADIAAMQGWIAAGYPNTGCGTGGGAGGAGGGSGVPDPFGAAPTCTSGTMWTRGNNGSANMNPGMACINCHTTSGGEGPRFAIAGTVYPTAHEPDTCNGANGSTGIAVQITGADGKTITLTPNSVGNFSYTGTVATPYQAKVTYMGRERAMATPQTSGDCNNCHTQTGAMSAPGRILLP